jgi:membrane-associated phospholipid phosphatase
VDYVNNWADLRSDRLREILTQRTPPYAYWGSVVPLYPERNAKTIELINVLLGLASVVAQRFKHSLCVRRPHEFSAQVQPIIQTPGHGSLPSGHATEAFAVAWLLLRLLSSKPGLIAPPGFVRQLMAQAARIAINRTVAGLHFPVDSLAGQVLGLSIGEYFCARCRPGGASTNVSGWRLDANDPLIADFSGGEIVDVTAPPSYRVAPLPSYAVQSTAVAVEGSDILNWLWNEALNEW